MVGQNKVVYLNTNRTSAASIGILNELRGLARARVEELLRQALDQVDDALFDRAEKAGSTADQTLFFATMRQVRLSRQTVVQTFAREMEGAFTRLTQPAPADVREPVAAERMSYSLELMDETVVEASVAAETVVGKIRTRCALALAQLSTRLDSLVAECSINESNSPLDPRQIVDAFVASIDRLDIEIQPKLIIFKLFEKQALLQLPSLYEAANRLLIDAGILPKLRSTGESPIGHVSGKSPSEPGADSAVTQEEQDGTALELLHQLLSRVRGGDPAQSEGRAAAPGGSGRSDVVQALSALQRQLTPEYDGTGVVQALNAEQIKILLGRSPLVASSSMPRIIGRAADDTIDIVSMLFDIILDDARLAPSIKAVIARLQIPVLKVAMLDRSFFNNRQHPARALINELAHAATGWVEPENPSADPLYCKMNEVMNRILEGFEEDIALFEQVLQDFRQFLEQERTRAQTVEARTREAAQGKAKVEDARERVQAEIERRLQAGAVPAIARQILEGAWFKVLFITCVKDGPQGQAWESQLALMDRLIWSVQPTPDPEQRQRVLASIPALLNDLREGLNAILYNPFEMARLFKELEAEHIRCLSATPAAPPAGGSTQGNEAPPVAGTSHGADDEPTAAAETLLSPEERCLQEEYLQRLASVDLGTWFEFSVDSGRQLRAK
ncbi:MAG TPA: DUF1631 domain-containing protein, partial [Nitrococcus sp.]|nr:DUF1631 domain-containing protein [Nitrococcus sp.]